MSFKMATKEGADATAADLVLGMTARIPAAEAPASGPNRVIFSRSPCSQRKVKNRG